MAQFSLHHLIYLVFLAGAYATLRTRRSIVESTRTLYANASEALIVLVLAVVIEVIALMVSPFGEDRSQLPHFVWQVTNALGSVKFVFTLYLAAFAFSNWRFFVGSHDYNAVHRLRDLDAIERSGRENLAIPSLDEFYDALFKVGEARQNFGQRYGFSLLH